MYEHQKHIIKEFISTALISEDPEEYLMQAFLKVIDIADDGDEAKSEVVEYLYEAEKIIPINTQ